MVEVVNTMSQITESRMPKTRAETRLLSMDPGRDNYGFAGLVFKDKRVRISRCGMIDETIKEVKEGGVLAEDAKRYLNRLHYLIKKSQAQHIGAERYVPRRQGLSNESVNMMLGTCVSYASTLNIETSLFLAATWKLRLKKVLDLESLYVACKPVPDHVVDAVFIGLFTAEKLGLFTLDSLRAKTQQKALCKNIQSRFLDLRTGLRSKKRTRAPSRRRKSK